MLLSPGLYRLDRQGAIEITYNLDMNHTGTQPEGELQSKTPAKYSRRDAILNGLAIAGAVTFVESNTLACELEVVRHTVPIANLDRPVRIVQLTDIHRSPYVLEPYVAKIVQEANAEAPDILLLTGDFVTGTSDYAESCMRQLATLHAPLGKYAVLG